MFENLTERLSRTMQQVRGKGRLTEDGIKATLREVRIALLEADVALPVVQTFIGEVHAKALGQEVLKSLTPGQAMVKLVHDELVQIMGTENEALDLKAQPPVPVLMAGLQGSGKTTTTAKLARLLIEQEKKRVMVVSCDVYRPAAIEQLKTLAGQVGAIFQPSTVDQKPAAIAQEAVAQARRQMCDVILVDTAGRLHIDDDMMAEIRDIHAAINPHETLFVVDAMTGQDAANTAAAFNDALALTGIVLTKTDGDARGGAALSVRQITGKPVKFLGSGEKTDALQPFHPERVASRILGMGDVLSLVEEVHRKVDQQEAEKLVKKIRRGRGFDLEDFKSQLLQMENMGGLGGLVDKLPGMSNLPDQVKSIRGSRKKRIALGSGTQIQAINRLLKQHSQMQRMMKKMGKGGMAKMMRKMGNLQGQLPGGKLPGGKMPF
jgi:signal recognition particle subunit SRP54